MLNIVLYAPEIPQNTGNIGRTCVITNTRLHLIKPYGFSLNEKALKRAGLDYWHLLDVYEYSTLDDFMDKHSNDTIFFSTTKAHKFYTEVQYCDNAYIMFGRESAGLPAHIHENYKDRRIKIPMAPIEEARSLNLANSVNIVLYEALRQQGFKNLR